MGLDEYLVVRGAARVTEGGAAELLQRLAHVYLSPDTRFPPGDNPPPGYVLRITPESAYYFPDGGYYLLRYDDVRSADDPRAMLLDFCQSTYEAAADLAKWDRKELER